ncbi:GTP-binding protein [Phototrophicus methaneseepsis]|uniref:GTP-binding protein n=1 Tax=Phototrophicus methaneseepsis TaxID=2710758 RepID=A0A7S8EB30_9CHLR|nr:GTP-binding protein [Phototrophicus methaneseepsis]QPC83569.1 GTP-binding protein [Phototrophicus methaneseepsis]
MDYPTPHADATPMTIITGFLGAGKTTLLNRILHGEHGLKLAVLVNDFGSVNIDSQLVTQVEAGDTIELSNGCICCTIRDDLKQAVLGLLAREDPPTHLLVETSGVSDPLEVALTFKYTPQVRIDSILTVVDAENILTVADDHRVLALNQIGMADLVIINKVDVAEADQLDRVHHYIRNINKKARTVEVVQADVPLAVLFDGGYDPSRPETLQPSEIHTHEAGHHHHDHEHSTHATIFETWSWRSDQPLSLKSLQRAIESLPTSIYRAKGFVYLADRPDERALLQVVGQRSNLTFTGETWGATQPYTQLVLIGKAGAMDTQALQSRFESTLAGQSSGLTRLAETAFSWLRRG